MIDPQHSKGATGAPSHSRMLGNLLTLYLGKVAGVVVGVLLLPLFVRLLGDRVFGGVAVVLSLQALAVMLDFGFPTLIGREIAGSRTSNASIGKLVAAAIFGLSAPYVAIFIVVAACVALGGFSSWSWIAPLGAVVLIWQLVLQNFYYSAIVSSQRYVAATFILVLGTIARGGATAYVLWAVSPTLEGFVVTQTAVAGMQTLWMRSLCHRQFPSKGERLLRSFPELYQDMVSLLSRGRSLVLFSAAGAAVTQLDKPLVSALASSASVTPYFLAITLCSTPISVFAGPVAQYFQPRLIRGIDSEDRDGSLRDVRLFVISLFSFTVVPASILWLISDRIVNLWLPGVESAVVVTSYVNVLLPGVVVGALGYVPFVLLVAVKGYTFQAVFSSIMTIVTLAVVAVFSWQGDILMVCWTFATYHVVSALGSWFWAMRSEGVAQMARNSLSLATLLLAVVASVVWIVRM
jgi:O-antigen/teichoic acid export membrane protein